MANFDELTGNLKIVNELCDEILVKQEKMLANMKALQTRADELSRAPVHAEQKCPDCKGHGIVKDGFGALFECARCRGMGISNRSAGG